MDDLKLFVNSSEQLDSFTNSVRIFSGDIKMAFGLLKSAVLILKRGKVIGSEEVVMSHK